MVRVEVVDVAGVLVTQDNGAFAEVTVRVLSGAGRVLAVHSGGPADIHPAGSATTQAYHGLVRALIRSTEDSATSARHRRLLHHITLDAGRGPAASAVRDPALEDLASEGPPAPIVVEATAKGLPPATLEISVTRDLAQLPLKVAAASMQRRERSVDEVAYI
mmetsp:Transcript_72585/g.208374  ORF Transcript_72585/g.208374 Transcript_72585/m.208374 type:complete len:162 (-) Transcript_72585:49-534(-)